MYVCMYVYIYLSLSIYIYIYTYTYACVEHAPPKVPEVPTRGAPRRRPPGDKHYIILYLLLLLLLLYLYSYFVTLLHYITLC